MVTYFLVETTQTDFHIILHYFTLFYSVDWSEPCHSCSFDSVICLHYVFYFSKTKRNNWDNTEINFLNHRTAVNTFLWDVSVDTFMIFFSHISCSDLSADIHIPHVRRVRRVVFSFGGFISPLSPAHQS